MSYSVGTAYLTILPEMSGIQAAIERQMRGVDGGRAGEAVGGSFLGGLAKKAAGIGAVIAGGLSVKGVLSSGLNRLTTIENATAALNVQFQDTARTGQFMDQILKTVQGTPFNLDQFANAGKNLVAFGASADKVPGYLKAMGEAAAASGQGAEAVDGLVDAFGKMTASGKVSLDQVWSISDKGIPALQILANHFNVTTADMQNMISKGAVPATEAMDALTKGIMEGSTGIAGTTTAFAGSMEALRKTFTGALGGLKASTARFGANLLKPWMDDMTSGMTGLADILDTGGKKLGALSADAANAVHTAFAVAMGKDDAVDDGPVLQWVAAVGENIRAGIADLTPAVQAAWAALTTGTFSGDTSVITSPIVQQMLDVHAKYAQYQPEIHAAWQALTSGAFDTTTTAVTTSPLVQAMLEAHSKFAEVKPGLVAAWKLLVTGDFQGGTPLGQEDSPLVGLLLSIRETVGQMFDTVKPVFQEIGATLGPAVISTFKQLFDAVAPLVPQILQVVSAFNPFSLIFKVLEPLLPTIVDLLAQLVQSVGGVLAKALQTAAPLVETLVGAFTSFAPILTDAIAPILPVIADTLTDLASVIGDALISALDALAPLFDAIVGVIGDLLPFVAELVKMLLPPLASLFQSIAPLVKAVLDALMPVVQLIADSLIPVLDALMPVVERVFTFIADTIGNIVQVFHGVIDFLTGIFTGNWEQVWTGIKEIFGGIWDQIKNIFSTLWDVLVEFFTNIGPALWGIVTGLAGQLIQWGGQFLGWIWQGIQDLWNNTIWPWFVALPGNVWNGIAAAAGWLVDRGKDFLQWIWDGITTKAVEVWDWFTNLPGRLWNDIQGGWQQVIGWGSDLIKWIWQGTDGNGGIVGAWNGVIDWFKEAPGRLWDAIQGLWSSATEWGGQLIKYVIDGISGSDPYISAELARTLTHAAEAVVPGLAGILDLSGVDIDKTIDQYLAQLQQQSINNNPNYNTSYGGRGGVPGRAMGGMFGPIDGHAGGQITVGTHGTADDVLIRGSRREFMVNEQATMNWLPVLEWINAGAIPGFAGGGLIGSIGLGLGANLMKAVLPTIQQRLVDAVTASLSAPSAAVGADGFNSSQDPSSFGWQRASGIVPFAWNGHEFVGGVAGGTQSLWTGLMNALVPQIPGGLMAPIWAYENRNNVNSPGNASFHAYGLAADINAPQNPNGAAGYGRSGPGVIPSGAAHSLAAQFGMLWGGDFTGTPDPMHFEIHLSPGQIGTTGSGSSLSSVFAGLFGSSGGGGTGTEQWRSTVLQALTLLGQPASFAGITLMQMGTESSGNPKAINLTDRNAQKGTPSKGLMQVIDPTFQAMQQFSPIPLTDIWNPLQNIVAGMLWEITNTGSLANWTGHAYDGGGWLTPGGFGVNLLNRPEAVLTPPQSDALVTHAQALQAGYSGGTPTLVLNLDNSDPLQVAVGQMIQDAWDRAEFDLDVAGARR